MKPQYLGDSVYATFDGFMVTLTTNNGLGPSNTIHLEPEVITALNLFYAQMTKSSVAEDAHEQVD